MLKFFALAGMFLIVAWFCGVGITLGSSCVFAAGFIGAGMFKKG